MLGLLRLRDCRGGMERALRREAVLPILDSDFGLLGGSRDHAGLSEWMKGFICCQCRTKRSRELRISALDIVVARPAAVSRSPGCGA